MHLTLNDHRVYHVAAIIDRDEQQKPHLARLTLDFDHRHVTAEGKGLRLAYVHLLGGKLDTGGSCLGRHLGERDPRARRADDAEAPVHQNKIRL